MNKASVSNVRQMAKKSGRKSPARTIKITARVSAQLSEAKRPGMSWGDYFELLAKRNKDTPYSQWQARNAAWAAHSLDLIAADLAERFPAWESMTPLKGVNRLVGLLELVVEISKIRSSLEEVYHA